MNNPFLHRIVRTLLEKNIPLTQTKLILPGKRPVVFLRALFEQSEYQGFLPEFYSIEQWVQEVSGKIPIQGIPLWIRAFQVFQKIDPNESFEGFLKWVPTILKDFNEIDIYTENPEELLNYMVDLERIENWGIEDYDASELLQNNQLFWQKLKPFYQALHQDLESTNQATSGMLFRSASESIENYLAIHPDTHFVWAGFNALSRVERIMFQAMSGHPNTHFLWDIDAYYFENPSQEAGRFFREYQRRYPDWNVDKKVVHEFEKPKNIKSLACPKQVIQAKYLTEYLASIPKEKMNSTAVVLADENALNTVLGSIPENVDQINITMGYPLYKNELVGFVEQLIRKMASLQLQKKWMLMDLNHLLLSYDFVDEEEEKALKDFESFSESSKNLYIDVSSEESLQKLTLFPLLEITNNVAEYLNRLLKYCQNRAQNSAQAPLKKAIYNALATIFENLILFESEQAFSWESLVVLYRTLIRNEQLDFIGKPLEGLQLMGLLETRLLNFENIVLLNVNEGIIPLGRTENSFIPFDVKKRFKIDTFLENDSIYAYHFLRLLQSANSVDLLYNNTSEGVQSGEKSRFIAQLELESPHEIQSETLKHSADIPIFSDEKEIEKTPAIEKQLSTWVKGTISPSSLNSYLYNPISFFQTYVLGIRDKERWQTHFSPQTLGTVVHAVLEKLYQPFCAGESGSFIPFTLENVKPLVDQIEEQLNDSLAKEGFPLEWFDKGSNLIEKKLAERMIHNLIQADIQSLKEGHQIEILQLEKFHNFTHLHPTMGKLTFGGIIDRIDKIDGIYRVIDYKTGKPQSLNWYDRSNNLKPLSESTTQCVQLSLYAQMMFQNFKAEEVLCGIYSMKQLREGVHYLNVQSNTLINKDNMTPIQHQIDDLISEILNPEIPFRHE